MTSSRALRRWPNHTRFGTSAGTSRALKSSSVNTPSTPLVCTQLNQPRHILSKPLEPSGTALQEVKEGGSNAQPGRRGGGGSGTDDDEKVRDPAKNDSTGGPETNLAEAAVGASTKPSQGGATREGGGAGARPKSSIALKKIEGDAMLRVRRDIRQPVTSLWQTAAERASTAPARALGGADVNARRGLPSRRQPLSEIGAARAQRGAEELADSRRGASADGENRDNGRGRASREGEPDDGRDISAPTRGPGGMGGERDQHADRRRRRRRTPIPLRSSHRVGPVGTLGAAKDGWLVGGVVVWRTTRKKVRQHVRPRSTRECAVDANKNTRLAAQKANPG